MPFRSKRQRGWLFTHKPALARKWARKYGTRIRKKKGK